jgi:hypothetical protein
MLGHCVNPECCAPLHSFSEGRLYQFEIVSISIAASDSAKAPFDERPERQAVHFWLCGRCAANFNLQLEPLQGLRVVPLVLGNETVNQVSGVLTDSEFGQSNRC